MKTKYDAEELLAFVYMTLLLVASIALIFLWVWKRQGGLTKIWNKIETLISINFRVGERRKQ